MIRVSYLNYDLHVQPGVDAFQAWLTTNITESASLLNIWYGEGLKVEIVIWDDGTGGDL